MPDVNLDRLRAMVHHVTRTYATEPQRLGSVKLHKILWWAEIRSLQSLGHTIADETFQKEAFGPFSNHLNQVVDELRASGHLYVVKGTDRFEVDIYVGKSQPARETLSEDEWRILDRVADSIVQDHTAGSISEKSHGPIWETVELHEPMPVCAAAIQWLSISDDDKAKALERLDH